MLSNSVGVAAYLLLRNDWSWGLLSDSEKVTILEANRSHNTERDDYSDPAQYGLERMEGGDNWDSKVSRVTSERGRLLYRILNTEMPSSVLEIGPSAGFLSLLSGYARPQGLEGESGVLQVSRRGLDRQEA